MMELRCEQCYAPMIPERDPYGTGDLHYYLYEPTCDCEEKPARYNGQDDEEE